MKKIFTTLLIFSCFLVFSSAIFSQEQQEITSTKTNSFELDIIPGVQSIFDKSMPLTLKIKSNVDTHKMQLRWKLPPGITPKNTGTTEWSSIKANQELITQIDIEIEKPGTYTIVAEVQDWRTNEVDTESIRLTFDNNLESAPQSEEYYRNQRVWFWARIGIVIIVISSFAVLGAFGMKAFRKWLAED